MQRRSVYDESITLSLGKGNIQSRVRAAKPSFADDELKTWRYMKECLQIPRVGVREVGWWESWWGTIYHKYLLNFTPDQ